MFAAAFCFALPKQQCEKLNLKVKFSCGPFVMHMISRCCWGIGSLIMSLPRGEKQNKIETRRCITVLHLSKQNQRKILVLFCRLYAESKVVNARPARVNTGTLKRRVTSRALFPDSFATHWLQRVFTTTTERRGFKIVLLCKNQFT